MPNSFHVNTETDQIQILSDLNNISEHVRDIQNKNLISEGNLSILAKVYFYVTVGVLEILNLYVLHSDISLEPGLFKEE